MVVATSSASTTGVSSYSTAVPSTAVTRTRTVTGSSPMVLGVVGSDLLGQLLLELRLGDGHLPGTRSQGKYCHQHRDRPEHALHHGASSTMGSAARSAVVDGPCWHCAADLHK